MSDRFNRENESPEDKLKKIDAFFDQFESSSTKKSYSNAEDFLSKFNELERREAESKAELDARRKTRMDRLNEKKSKSSIMNKSTKKQNLSSEQSSAPKKKTKSKPRYRLNFRKFILFLMLLGFIGCVVIGITAIKIIKDSPEIDPNNIYSVLSESSTIYDDQGNAIDNLTAFSAEGTRTNVAYKDLPPNLVNAFVSLEDKTFWDHHGFNYIRIVGAVKDSFTSGRISGTSTITQQLARNLYLSETKQERSLTRKLREAYYTTLLEKHLTKEEIIEAYLNTIYLGYNSYGVQAASQAYFSKDVGDLDLSECAALAALPQAPHSYAWVKKINPEDISNPDDPKILVRGDEFFYVYNDNAESRRELCLKLMAEQGIISDEMRDTAVGENFQSHIQPSVSTTSEISSYFADYVVEDVINALVKYSGKTEQEASQMIYTGGLQIYTTMNSNMQKIVESTFSNSANFPSVTNLNKDRNGNIVNDGGGILLYNFGNYFQPDGSFLLGPEDFQKNSDGSITIFKGRKLNIYKTAVNGVTDYSLELKNMYTIDNGIFYSIGGGVISIPAQYKTRDAAGNLVVSAELFDDMPSIFVKDGDSYKITSNYYTLRQKVIQPQGAMVISDPYTGGVKAMVGGRGTVGRLLFNRATNPRQPGSSIKPIGVYAPALQAGADAAASGQKMSFSDSTGVAQLMGDYFTPASVIDDTPLVIQGKQWPKNWYSGYRGLYTMRTSIEQSVNVNAVRIFQQLGVQKSLTFLKGVGISSIVENGTTNDLNAAALALGGMTRGISPLEMSAAYSTFVNDGTYTKPILFTRVANRKGETLIENEIQTSKAMDPGVAFLMRDMLRSTVTAGLGSSAAIPNQPVAGKTGTTTDNYDAWFVGFTPQYSAAVWLGNDVNIELSQGSVSAARLWSKVMSQVCANIPTGSYHPAPSNVISATIDTKSGRIPSSLSGLDPRGTVRTEYFIKGTEPTETDHVHASVSVCTVSGYLATPSCTSVRKVVGVRRPYFPNPSVGDIGYEVPHYYCPIHNPDPSTYAVSGGSGTYTFNGGSAPADNATTPDNNQNTQNPAENGENQGGEGNSGNSGNDNNSTHGNGTTNEPGNGTVPDWLLTQ